MTKYSLTLCIAVIIAFYSSFGFAQGVKWQTNLERASQRAARENKLVLLHFGASWCRPCHALETYVFTNPRVHRAMQDNVIPVKIDVDEKPVLVKEYGVSSVPFDVVITPAGRVVAKRSSPRDASTYAEMVTGLNRVINGLNKGNPALHEQLDQLKDQMFTDNQIVENKSFAPSMPVHRAPSASRDSAHLKRTSRIINPFNDNASESQSEVASKPKKIENNQLVQSSTPAKIKNPMAAEYKTTPATSGPPIPNGRVSDDPSMARNVRVANNLMPLSPLKDKAEEANLVATPSPSVIKGIQPKSKMPLEPKTSPIQMDIANQAENSFAPPPVAAAAGGFRDRNSRDMTKSNDFLPAAATKASGEAKRIQIAKQTGFLPSDQRPNAAQPIATAALQAGTAQANQFSGSASLAIPGTKSINEKDKNQLNDKIAGEMDQNPEESQIVLAAKSNDFAPAKMPSSLKPDFFRQDSQRPSSQTVADAPMKNLATKNELPDNVALHGKCPITLLKHGKWTDGDPKWGCIHRNRLYLFSSEANMREFQADPDANSPLLAGYDPVIFRNSGELVDGIESHGVFMGKSPNQRVVLFSSAKTRAEFETNPKNYIETIRQAMQAAGGASSKLLR